jgi:hypothetical protein
MAGAIAGESQITVFTTVYHFVVLWPAICAASGDMLGHKDSRRRGEWLVNGQVNGHSQLGQGAPHVSERDAVNEPLLSAQWMTGAAGHWCCPQQ